jgi:hypothetical protein
MFFDDCPIGLHIDCETLSLDPRAHILQVGYYVGNMITGEELGRRCYWIDPQHQKGRVIDPDTVRWWLAQDPTVMKGAWHPPGVDPEYTTPQELFDQLGHLIGRFDSHLRVWTRGHKDLIWLETLWDGKTPWHYRQAADMRPFVNILDPQGLQKPSEEAGKHDAMWDAVYQATHLENVVGMLREVERLSLTASNPQP